MAGILLEPVQVDSKSGVLTLFHALSNDLWGPCFEVTYKPYNLVAYGLQGAQKATLYHVAQVASGVRQAPFVYNGTAVELTVDTPTATVALTGTYRLVLSGGLKTVIVKAIPQQIVVDRAPPIKSAIVNSMQVTAGVYSDTLQVFNKPHTVIAYDLVGGDTVQVFVTANGLVAPYTPYGEPIILTDTNTTTFLEQTNDYLFLSSVTTILGLNPNYVEFENPYKLQGVQGIQGIPGPMAGYVYTQVSPNTIWTINHNLGFKPSVELFSVGGVEFEGTVVHTSINQTVVTLSAAVAGTARLT